MRRLKNDTSLTHIIPPISEVSHSTREAIIPEVHEQLESTRTMAKKKKSLSKNTSLESLK